MCRVRANHRLTTVAPRRLVLVELGSALIGGLAGGTIAAIIGAYVTLRQQARQHAHELRMSREARFADRIRELAARLIVLAERYPPAVREQLLRRRWDTGRLPLPDADNSFFGVARELPLLLRSQPALDALTAFVAAVARVESSWSGPIRRALTPWLPSRPTTICRRHIGRSSFTETPAIRSSMPSGPSSESISASARLRHRAEADSGRRLPSRMGWQPTRTQLARQRSWRLGAAGGQLP